MTLQNIELWHKRARPTPDEHDLNVQFGCHFEEFVEMLQTVDFECDSVTFEGTALIAAMHDLSMALKSGEVQMRIVNRKDFLDSIADQVVTGIGVAHCAHMNGSEAIRRVNTSNWSKFDSNGKPIKDATGKIRKGLDYKMPDLEGLY